MSNQQQQQQHPDHIYNQSTGTTGVNEVLAPTYNEKPPPPASQPSYHQDPQPLYTHPQDTTSQVHQGQQQPGAYTPDPSQQHQYHIQDPTLGEPQQQYHVQDPNQQQYHVQDPTQQQYHQQQQAGTPIFPDGQYNQHTINQGAPPPPADFYAPQPKQDYVPGGQYQQQPGLQQQPQVGLNNGQSPISLDRLQRYPDLATCPNCSHTERTRVENHSGGTTHLAALVTCCIICLGCIPYLIDSLKDAEHYCGHCGALLAIWHRSGHTEVLGRRGGPAAGKKPVVKANGAPGGVAAGGQPVELTNNGNKTVHA